MALKKYKIGDLIEIYSKKCGIENLTAEQVSGINSNKQFFEPAKQVGANTKDYKIVPPNYFACNLMHVGRDMVLPIALNTTNHDKIVSPAYTVFKLINEETVLKEFFFIFLNSKEKDRLFWFYTDSSVRDGLSWDIFCDVDIEIPSIETQQKYVNVYKAMVANQKAYEKGLDDLKLVCDAYIEDLKKKCELIPISNICTLSDLRNTDEKETNVKGLTVHKQFIETKADMDGVSLKNYKIVNVGDIAYVPTTNRNGDKLACGLATEKCIVSSTYNVINVNTKLCCPSYLFLWFRRTEMDRYVRYNSWGSAREVIEWNDLGDYRIPLPHLDVQNAIANIYQAYWVRKEINEKLKAQIKDLCPILIAGAVQEAKKEV